jgi:hypothetical protein
MGWKVILFAFGQCFLINFPHRAPCRVPSPEAGDNRIRVFVCAFTPAAIIAFVFIYWVSHMSLPVFEHEREAWENYRRDGSYN